MRAIIASFRDYYQLTKPGIIYGNIITTIGGFFLAAGTHLHLVLFVATVLGSSLVIASGCVFNNYLDRGIDENDPILGRVDRLGGRGGRVRKYAGLFEVIGNRIVVECIREEIFAW